MFLLTSSWNIEKTHQWQHIQIDMKSIFCPNTNSLNSTCMLFTPKYNSKFIKSIKFLYLGYWIYHKCFKIKILILNSFNLHFEICSIYLILVNTLAIYNVLRVLNILNVTNFSRFLNLTTYIWTWMVSSMFAHIPKMIILTLE